MTAYRHGINYKFFGIYKIIEDVPETFKRNETKFLKMKSDLEGSRPANHVIIGSLDSEKSDYSLWLAKYLVDRKIYARYSNFFSIYQNYKEFMKDSASIKKMRKQLKTPQVLFVDHAFAVKVFDSFLEFFLEILISRTEAELNTVLLLDTEGSGGAKAIYENFGDYTLSVIRSYFPDFLILDKEFYAEK